MVKVLTRAAANWFPPSINCEERLPDTDWRTLSIPCDLECVYLALSDQSDQWQGTASNHNVASWKNHTAWGMCSLFVCKYWDPYFRSSWNSGFSGTPCPSAEPKNVWSPLTNPCYPCLAQSRVGPWQQALTLFLLDKLDLKSGEAESWLKRSSMKWLNVTQILLERMCIYGQSSSCLLLWWRQTQDNDLEREGWQSDPLQRAKANHSLKMQASEIFMKLIHPDTLSSGPSQVGYWQHLNAIYPIQMQVVDWVVNFMERLSN